VSLTNPPEAKIVTTALNVLPDDNENGFFYLNSGKFTVHPGSLSFNTYAPENVEAVNPFSSNRHAAMIIEAVFPQSTNNIKKCLMGKYLQDGKGNQGAVTTACTNSFSTKIARRNYEETSSYMVRSDKNILLLKTHESTVTRSTATTEHNFDLTGGWFSC
jgi:hypothetical protein